MRADAKVIGAKVYKPVSKAEPLVESMVAEASISSARRR